MSNPSSNILQWEVVDPKEVSATVPLVVVPPAGAAPSPTLATGAAPAHDKISREPFRWPTPPFACYPGPDPQMRSQPAQ